VIQAAIETKAARRIPPQFRREDVLLMGQKKWLGIVCLLAAATIWGGMYVVSKYVLLYSAPFVVLWLRYMIAFCCLLPIMLFSKNEKIRREDMPLIGWLGFTGFLSPMG
jgi:drug/metabolite transporter (DMT)-like permease